MQRLSGNVRNKYKIACNSYNLCYTVSTVKIAETSLYVSRAKTPGCRAHGNRDAEYHAAPVRLLATDIGQVQFLLAHRGLARRESGL